MVVAPRKFNAGTRSKASKPLADFVPQALGDAFSKFGFAQGDLILHWADVVGAKIASQCAPVKLQWPAGARKRANEGAAEPATLVLQVEGYAALEIQHLSAIILQRVNGFFGWRCVGKISLRQAPLQRTAPVEAPVKPNAAQFARAQEATMDIDDAPLRAALIRLGAQVLKAK